MARWCRSSRGLRGKVSLPLRKPWRSWTNEWLFCHNLLVMHKLKDNTLITGIDVLGCSPIRKNDFSRVQLCSYDLIKSMKNTKIELKSLLVYLFPFFLLVISRLSLILFSVWKWKKEVSCLLDSIWIPNWHLSGFGILWILNTGLTPIIYRYFSI